ncbi:MAG: DUF494 family protein [Xanthomonadales bacterium]|nr:DUF494 family protein [Xanthomonadales bacterium]
MKESVLDVLLYLFEHYFAEPVDLDSDRASLQGSLLEAGFSPAEISKAFVWLDGLSQQRAGVANPVAAVAPLRVFADAELLRLDAECRGFLMFLEQNGVLDATSRELVLERVMALDSEEIDLEDLKWVVLMVLFAQPGLEEAFAWMEGHLFEREGVAVH